ncbi:MAG: hypothetical protein JWO11_2889, partial [Nocardioides sp.]|nr:hypothetical protein [Nocardioides sp.]
LVGCESYGDCQATNRNGPYLTFIGSNW